MAMIQSKIRNQEFMEITSKVSQILILLVNLCPLKRCSNLKDKTRRSKIDLYYNVNHILHLNVSKAIY